MAAPMLSLNHHHHHNPSASDDKELDTHNSPDQYPVPAALVLPAESFLKAAISLKDQVVEVTWRRGGCGRPCLDPTVYTGLMGTAFACLRSYEATGNPQDLTVAAEIADACTALAGNRGVTFLCGRAGIYALGAVVSNYMNDYQRRDMFLDLLVEVGQEKALPVGPEEGGFGMSYELLHGRAGFLWTILFINKHLGPDTVPTSLVAPVVEAILAGGRAGASDSMKCPLMYRWHGTRYWGAAHGLAGIMQVLLHFPLSGGDLEDVKGTLRYMVRNRFRSGNYPSSEANPHDRLIQWCHGAGGVAITLCKAAEVFSDDREFRNASVEAGEVVWKKGLDGKVGLSDGISGNAYTFLSLYRLTGDKVHLERAKSFASFLFYNTEKLISNEYQNGDDQAYSFFEGLAGVACLWFDVVTPQNSRFPGFEI